MLKVALTVDDVPSHGPIPPGAKRKNVIETMLSAFEKHKLTGVFGFLNGKGVEEEPEVRDTLALWKKLGHHLGNHTFSHLNLAQVSLEQFIVDIKRNETLIPLTKYFRLPFLSEGSTEKREGLRCFLNESGYRLAPVTIDFSDCLWSHRVAETKFVEAYFEQALAELEWADRFTKSRFARAIPHILVVHCGFFQAVNMDSLLQIYKSNGVQFISLEEALEDKAYEFDLFSEDSSERFLRRCFSKIVECRLGD